MTNSERVRLVAQTMPEENFIRLVDAALDVGKSLHAHLLLGNVELKHASWESMPAEDQFFFGTAAFSWFELMREKRLFENKIAEVSEDWLEKEREFANQTLHAQTQAVSVAAEAQGIKSGLQLVLSGKFTTPTSSASTAGG